MMMSRNGRFLVNMMGLWWWASAKSRSVSAFTVNRNVLRLSRPSLGYCSPHYSSRNKQRLKRFRRQLKYGLVTRLHNQLPCSTSSSHEHSCIQPSFGNSSEIDSAFEECWASDSWTANPDKDEKIDTILQGLVSPAPQSFYVLQRALNIYSGNLQQYQTDPCSHLFKDGHDLLIRSDLLEEEKPSKSTSLRPGIDWIVVSRSRTPDSGWTAITTDRSSNRSLNKLAIDLLSLVADASDAQTSVNTTDMDVLVQKLQERLAVTLGTDARGRTAADTAFALALAGVVAPTLFRWLYKVARLELMRVGQRPSQRSKVILHVVEKVAASGGIAADCEVMQTYKTAAKILREKGEYLDVAYALTNGKFDLLQPRPLLWLWRFSTRLTKPKPQQQENMEEDESSLQGRCFKQTWLPPGFKDNSRPLVIDLGCGFGVSLLGLASSSSNVANGCTMERELLNCTHLSDCNFLGVDLNQLSIRYASGISRRWRSHIDTDRLQYTWASAEDLLDSVESMYAGRVALILLQFPTPFRLLDKQDPNDQGNRQLPIFDTESGGFMASSSVFSKIARLLKKGNGRLLIQSNCEDVAVRMRDMAVQQGLSVVPALHSVQQEQGDSGMTQRTEKWIQYCSANSLEYERAVGADWSSEQLLPPGCATETEVSCQLEGTPVHRCLLQAVS